MEGDVSNNLTLWMTVLLRVVLPVVLGAISALLVNRFLNKHKVITESRCKIIDEIRSDVRSAIEIASKYWGGSSDNKIELESKIRSIESDIRKNYSCIDLDKKSDLSVDSNNALRDFLSSLTGADFESKSVAPNPTHLMKVAVHGAELRRCLIVYREHLVGSSKC